MKNLLLSLLLLLAGATLPHAARAQFVPFYLDANATWYPAAGLYWSPAEHGNYYHVSIGPDGYVFVALTLFDASGAPTFYVMQGPLALAPQSVAPATLGTLRSPLYRMADGQCLDCPYRAPEVGDSGLGEAEIVFRIDARAEFRHGGRVTPLERYPLFTTASQFPRNRLVGDWVMHVSGASAGNTPGPTQTVDVRITPFAGPAPVQQTTLAFRAGELLALDCLDCADWSKHLLERSTLGVGLIGARDDQRLRYLNAYPDLAGTLVLRDDGFLHERDGVFYGRGGSGQFLYSFVMTRKLAPRARPEVGAP